MHRVTGQCRCGAACYEADFLQAPQSLQPRACDCNYCQQRQAAWMSDAGGSLRLVSQTSWLREQQGSGQAAFLSCAQCEELLAVCYVRDGQCYAALNTRLSVQANWAACVPASPQRLSASEKAQRWQKLWFSQVMISP